MLPINTPTYVYLEEQLVILAVDARFGHPNPLLLVHLVAEVRQVDGVEIRALQKRVQAVLGAQVSLLLRGGKKTHRASENVNATSRVSTRRGLILAVIYLLVKYTLHCTARPTITPRITSSPAHVGRVIITVNVTSSPLISAARENVIHKNIFGLQSRTCDDGRVALHRGAARTAPIIRTRESAFTQAGQRLSLDAMSLRSLFRACALNTVSLRYLN